MNFTKKYKATTLIMLAVQYCHGTELDNGMLLHDSPVASIISLNRITENSFNFESYHLNEQTGIEAGTARTEELLGVLEDTSTEIEDTLKSINLAISKSQIKRALINAKERKLKILNDKYIFLTFTQPSITEDAYLNLIELILNSTEINQWISEPLEINIKNNLKNIILNFYNLNFNNNDVILNKLIPLIANENNLNNNYYAYGIDHLLLPPIPPLLPKKTVSDLGDQSSLVYDLKNNKYYLTKDALRYEPYDIQIKNGQITTRDQILQLIKDDIKIINQNHEFIESITVAIPATIIESKDNPTIDITFGGLDISSSNGMAEVVLSTLSDENLLSRNIQLDSDSPFLKITRKALSEIEKSELIKAADSNPLILIDYDFKSGHGSKVMSVAHSVLEDLGVSYLKKKILLIDLAPSGKSDDVLINKIGKQISLEKRVDRYIKKIRFNTLKFRLDYQIKSIYDAEQYFKSETLNDQFILDIPEIILTAVFSDLISSLKDGPYSENPFESVVLSTSFYISKNQAIEFDFSYKLLDLKNSWRFLIVAAASSRSEENSMPDLAIPQNFAYRFENEVLNITSTSCRTGKLLAVTATGSIPLHGIAPGCGFNHENITSKDSGSSFAAPYVSTSLWILNLLKGRSVIFPKVHRIVHDNSFNPVLNLSKDLISEFYYGKFDSMSAVAGITSYFIDHSNALHHLEKCSIEIIKAYNQAEPNSSFQLNNYRLAPCPTDNCFYIDKNNNIGFEKFMYNRSSRICFNFNKLDSNRRCKPINEFFIEDNISFLSCRENLPK